MPLSVGAVGATGLTSANDFVSSLGFARTKAMANGPAALGQGADVRDTNFGSILSTAVERIQTRQDYAKDLGIRAVTGRLDNVHDYTIAAAESKMTLELTAAIRNKAVDAFNEVMRMQA
ncbi:MAG: flagellar hook-basal body complex protein FliE [Actinomycetaceae bacterium]|nr:flagellar hook-basal body complex protein FliE [Actinomycetaceae bacterium]